MEVIQNRHPARSYTDLKIGNDTLAALQAEINACNSESELSIQIIINEPNALGGFMAHYGNFSGVKNYIALIGKKSADLEERAGYYGERIVLKAGQLGLNTCWVALTFSKHKSKYVVGKDEKLVCVIAIGYGVTQGVPHKNKPIESLCKTDGNIASSDGFNNGERRSIFFAMQIKNCVVLIHVRHLLNRIITKIQRSLDMPKRRNFGCFRGYAVFLYAKLMTVH